MIRWPLAHWLFHIEPSVVAKHANGTPANAAPPAKTSGYAPSRTFVIMAPDDAPVANTRAGSPPYRWSVQLTIDTMPCESLPPLWRSVCGEETSKQLPDRVAVG